jgi:malonyl-CoA O-methyltransferase
VHALRLLDVARRLFAALDGNRAVSARDLANVAAYDSWARTYPPLAHNALMRAEQRAMLEQWPEVRGACALDLASGTGRYSLLLQETGAARVVAADLSAGMLRRSPIAARIRADMARLPFTAETFDAVVCGLSVGHAASLEQWMLEVARVLKPGGRLLYSDFHADAAAAGMTRSFTDADSRKHTLRHRRYERAAHSVAAAAAGLELESLRELRIGEDLREEFAGSDELYRRWRGLAIVLVVRARKSPP